MAASLLSEAAEGTRHAGDANPSRSALVRICTASARRATSLPPRRGGKRLFVGPLHGARLGETADAAGDAPVADCEHRVPTTRKHLNRVVQVLAGRR